MSKTLTDLHLWLDDLSDELYHQRKILAVQQGITDKNVQLPFLSLEIFNDKTWRIQEHIGGGDVAEVKVLLISEDMDNPHHDIDVYDLLNMSAASIAEKIIADDSVRDIQMEDL